MSVYIASMNMRGKWAERPENTVVLNVTSAQSKTSQNRKDFSPMSKISGGYKGYYCFENYWQSGKVYEGMNELQMEKHSMWWRSLKEGKRKYPPAKGVKVLHSNYDGIVRDYISSRKEIYLPEYTDLVRGSESLKKWKETLEKGVNIVVYDFDGPRSDSGELLCEKMTEELFYEKLNDVRRPFGHGYIVAAVLAKIIE